MFHTELNLSLRGSPGFVRVATLNNKIIIKEVLCCYKVSSQFILQDFSIVTE